VSGLNARSTTSGSPRGAGLAPPIGHLAGWQPPFALHEAAQPHLLYHLSKRLIDIALSALLLLIALPLILISCMLIIVFNRQNPLLLQSRSGLQGREFTMLKLRTMRVGEDEPDRTDDVLVGKTIDDCRVTGVGRILRRTSIDELPQLFNVLTGQMSLVGPRPGLPVEVARYPYSWRRRLSVKPGLTGLWQVSGRSEVPAWRRTAMDRYYIRNRSLGFDWLILMRTVAATISMRGAW
jgi:lipopolysaccharide/colanic/teichoic acid biosynthesis glycosyltransferase